MQTKLKHTKSILTTLGLAAVLGLTPTRSARAAGPTQAGAPSNPLYGPDISAELGNLAVKANPTIGAAQDRIQALEQQVRQSGVWMDPTFSAEYSNMPIDSPIPGRHPMSGIQLTLRQTFYWPGKTGAREDEAQSRVRQERLTLAEQRVQLRAIVKRAYYRLALNRQLRAVTGVHVQLAGDFLDVVRVKNEAGVVPQHELLRMHVLVDQLKDDLLGFDEDEQALTALINATLHRPPDVAVPTPEQTPVEPPVADALALTRRAERQRPSLQRAAVAAETYRASARRAAREGYPDITLWAGYRVRTQAGTDPGTDFVSLGASLPIPFTYDGRWGSEELRNEKLAQAAVEDRSAELDRIRGDLGRLLANWKRSVQKARTYRESLTPEARLTLDATFASYQVGRADFSSLFQAEVQLLNFERTTRMAESSAAEARVEAEALVGGGAR